MNDRLLLHRACGTVLLSQWRDRVIEANQMLPLAPGLSDEQILAWYSDNRLKAYAIQRAISEVTFALSAMEEGYWFSQANARPIMYLAFTLS